jgi:hypothetical protein
MVDKVQAKEVFPIKVNVSKTDEIFFHMRLGTADYQGEEMEASISMGGDIVLRFRGERYVVGLSEIGVALWEKVTKDD